MLGVFPGPSGSGLQLSSMTFSIGLVSTIARKQLAFPPPSSKGVGLEVRVGPRCWKTKGKLLLRVLYVISMPGYRDERVSLGFRV